MLSTAPATAAAEPAPCFAGRADPHRIRLLVITDTPVSAIGGSERFIRRLLTGLEPEAFKVDVIQLADAPDSPAAMPAGARAEPVCHPVGPVYGRAGRTLWKRLRPKVAAGSWDIVHSQHEKSDLLCALLPRGRNGPRWISSRRDSGFQRSAAVKAAFRLLDHRFDRLVAPSRSILDDLARRGRVPEKRLRLIPNGVDTARFAPPSPDARALGRARLGLAPDQFALGCVARMVPVKRHRDLIEALARLSGSRPGLRLVLIGDGPLEQALRAEAQRVGVGPLVHFLGRRQDVDTLLPLLDAFVLCSATEGMSNALLEAMAAGLPVVATAVGGNTEVVLDGQSGLLAPPAAPERLAAAIDRLVADPSASHAMGCRGRAHVERKFSDVAMIAAWRELYRELAVR